MTGPPVLPTILVAAAVAPMIGLGLWQMKRAEWKDRLLADYAQAAALPALDLDPLIARGADRLPRLAFRRVLVTCHANDMKPDLRGGSSGQGSGGYSYFIPCRPGAAGLGGRLLVNAGWTALPDNRLHLSLEGLVAGRLGADEEDEPIILTSATAAPPLQPSMPLTIESIPNNHRAYVFTWFAFAATALMVYLLALRRRNAPRLPPEP